MLHKYFSFGRKRIAFFCVIVLALLGVQYYLSGSMVSLQQITTEAGNSNSSVIGVLDDTEVVRQKFSFDRRVILTSFTISFGSFDREKVGDILHIQMTDGNNNVVYETEVPVDDITANADYTVNMEHSVTIPKGVSCCIRLSCSSDKSNYETIPTVNTTNRTSPNTYMSTLKMQTRSKSINISYSYNYRQIYPLVVLVAEYLVLFLLVFERLSSYAPALRKRRQKELRKRKRERVYKEEKMAERSAQGKTNASEQRRIEHKRRGKTGMSAVRRKQRSLKDFVKWCLAEPKAAHVLRILIMICNPLFLAVMLEIMNGTAANILPNVWIFTWILLGAVQLILMALTGNSSIAMLIMDLILFPAGLANLFIMNVRGTPFLPADILGVATATEVASTYTFSLTPAQYIMIPAFVIWCVLLFKTRTHRKRNWKRRLIHVAATAVPGIVVVLLLYNTNVLAACGIKDNVWNKVSSCKSNGFYMNYFINLHYLKVSAPSGYSQAKVEEILNEVKEDKADAEVPQASDTPDEQKSNKVRGNSDFSSNTALEGKKPNIILIMNESLADFSLVGNMDYNQDPLPFIHSMKENTIKGIDYVSVFGAGTSNSEFEAMTGNSMAFFPSGSNVYQQFMHDSTFSLPSYLKTLGYRCEAIHPSSGANWNRIATYKSMKFDSFITIDDFKNPEYIRYISDKESYKKVIERYEAKGDEPLFVFDMTIQNHGGYLTHTNWEDPVYVKNSYYSEAKEYLSAIHVSDQAFEYLVDYFSQQDEPTIICMFGDHFPSIETDFYEELLGKEQSEWELEDIQKRYAAPFVIWANYDIEEGENVVLGNNYLENLLLKQSGIELPLYNQYLEKMSQEIPAMNVNGYMDKEGNWHAYNENETDTVSLLLDNYEILQYGYYSDMDKEKMGELFEMEP